MRRIIPVILTILLISTITVEANTFGCWNCKSYGFERYNTPNCYDCGWDICPVCGACSRYCPGPSYSSSPKKSSTTNKKAPIQYKSVKFKANGGKFKSSKYAKKSSYSVKIAKGKSIGKLPVMKDRKGYKFIGWFSDKTYGKKITKNTKINKKKTFYAQWSIKSYDVIFKNINGTNLSNSKKIKYKVNYPTPSQPGKKFLGWYTKNKGGKKVTKHNLTKARKIYARWSTCDYTVSFANAKGSGLPSSKKVTYNTAYPVPKLAGNTFLGWYTAPNSGQRVTKHNVEYSRTIYARWSVNSYTVKYVNADGTNLPASQEIKYNQSYPIPTKNGIKFLGWYTSKIAGTKVTKHDVTTGRTIYARWDDYTVKFFGIEGTNTASSLQMGYGTTYPIPYKPGFEFLGWFTTETGNLQVAKHDVTADRSIYARWKTNTYKVTYENIQGTGLPSSQIIEYNDKYPTPKLPGNTFLGWFTKPSGGEKVEFHQIASSVTIYAIWDTTDNLGINPKLINQLGKTFSQINQETNLNGGFSNYIYDSNYNILDNYQESFAKDGSGRYYYFKDGICVIIRAYGRDMLMDPKGSLSDLDRVFGTPIETMEYTFRVSTRLYESSGVYYRAVGYLPSNSNIYSIYENNCHYLYSIPLDEIKNIRISGSFYNGNSLYY